MPELYPYPRFSLAERDSRWKAVRAKMAEQNIDVIVTPQNTGHSMDFQANTRYLTHCGGGGRSALAAESLQKMGYKNVRSMAGGFKAWKAAGLPTTK